MEKKLVDIVITTYHRNDRLKKTLEILSNQTIKDFNLIINDDGNIDLINPNDYPVITKYIWNKDFGYHRVARFNESLSLCVSPYIIMLDDDCIPHSNTFIESYLNDFKNSDVIRGIVQFPDGARANSWFSTANAGIKKIVYDDIGLFDVNFDGHYGHEDRDLGLRLESTEYKINFGSEGTRVNHGIEIYANGDRSESIIGHNTKYFTEKWGFNPRGK